MSWKCYTGKPIEFTGTYLWAQYHAKTMLKFSWTHKPYLISISSGLTVEPKLQHLYENTPPDYPVKHPSLPSDLHLIVHGTGFPKHGHLVKLKWVQMNPMSGKSKVYARQFVQLQTAKITVGATKYTIEFASGYSEQEYGKPSGNVALWRVCYDGPYKYMVAWKVSLPKPWEVQVMLDLLSLINKISVASEEEECDVPERISEDLVYEWVKLLQDADVPGDHALLRDETVKEFEQVGADLMEVEHLIHDSNRARGTERMEMRRTAIELLTRSHDRRNRVIELLVELSRVPEK